MFGKIKEWISDFKVWATAVLALIAERAFGIIDMLLGLIG